MDRYAVVKCISTDSDNTSILIIQSSPMRQPFRNSVYKEQCLSVFLLTLHEFDARILPFKNTAHSFRKIHPFVIIDIAVNIEL